MAYSKLRTSSDALGRLRGLRQRTGLTPNLLVRVAVMLSLEEGPVGALTSPDEAGLEFNAYTLTGEFTGIFLSLVRFVEDTDPETPLSPEEVIDRLRAHIHRGVAALSVRAKAPADILKLAASKTGQQAVERPSP